jgi:replication initiation protein RepC
MRGSDWMSIAQLDHATAEKLQRLTPGGGLPLSSVLPDLQIEADGTWEISKLANAAERARWAASVYVCLRARRQPTIVDAKAMRDRVLVALRYLAKRGSVTHPMSKALWNKLYVLTTMCAHEPDWGSASGPLMGASNKTLEDRWNVSNARRSLRDLAQWGFVIPFCPKGNGHRSYKKTKDGPVGAGWSLAPLRLLVDALEEIAAREEHLRMTRLEIPERIKSAIGAIRALITPFRETDEWARAAQEELEALCRQRDRVNRGALPALGSCLSAALRLLEVVENNLFNAGTTEGAGMESSTGTDTPVHYQYNAPITESVCIGSAGNRSGDRSVRPITPRQVRLSQGCFQEGAQSDPFGIVRSGFSWTEAPHLFPFHCGMIDLTRGPVNGTVDVLGRILGISPASAQYAERRLGREAAVVCLLITGQHHYEGGIQKTPEAYLRGIIRKAAKGELNLGHSLFGRRELAEPGRSPVH